MHRKIKVLRFLSDGHKSAAQFCSLPSFRAAFSGFSACTFFMPFHSTDSPTPKWKSPQSPILRKESRCLFTCIVSGALSCHFLLCPNLTDVLPCYNSFAVLLTFHPVLRQCPRLPYLAKHPGSYFNPQVQITWLCLKEFLLNSHELTSLNSPAAYSYSPQILPDPNSPISSPILQRKKPRCCFF